VPTAIAERFLPQIGFHFIQAMQYATGATATFNGVISSQQVQGLTVSLAM
jgi:hypothetical protein